MSQQPSIGIDLGTTNSALAWIDPADAEDTSFPPIQVFDIPQMVAAGRVEGRRTLPSFVFLDEGQPVEACFVIGVDGAFGGDDGRDRGD